jgi:hypothetical protein
MNMLQIVIAVACGIALAPFIPALAPIVLVLAAIGGAVYWLANIEAARKDRLRKRAQGGDVR